MPAAVLSVRQNGPVEGTRLRFAVADGATETSFSKNWAHLLVRGYKREWIGGAATERGLERLARIWRSGVVGKSLPWHAQHKVHDGAYAALLGLEVTGSLETEAGTWNAYAVGDCCLFHLAGDCFLESFPITDPEQFGSRPILLSSVMARNRVAIASASTASGVWEAGDAFYLMSDALAAWFLSEQQADNNPWPLARELGTDEAEREFPQWISEIRALGALRNDDVTLVRIATV